jgi:hypothetical protein
MMRDCDRSASLFTPDGALRMPDVPVELWPSPLAAADGHAYTTSP